MTRGSTWQREPTKLALELSPQELTLWTYSPVVSTLTAIPRISTRVTRDLVKYLPSWFPGTGFKAVAEEWKKVGLGLLHDPCDHAKKSIVCCSSHFDRFLVDI
jgi:hypothetical protein